MVVVSARTCVSQESALVSFIAADARGWTCAAVVAVVIGGGGVCCC